MVLLNWQILELQLACLILVIGNVQEILLLELHAGKFPRAVVRCGFYLVVSSG